MSQVLKAKKKESQFPHLSEKENLLLELVDEAHSTRLPLS